MNQASLTKAAGIVAFLTVISEILGFIRETFPDLRLIV